MNASEKGFDKDTVMPAGYQKNDATAACPAINPSGTILLGVYYGNQGWAMSDVTAMENWQCKKTR